MRWIPITTNTRPTIVKSASKIRDIDMPTFTTELNQRIGSGFYYGHSYPGENQSGTECYLFITDEALKKYYDISKPDNGQWFSASLKENV